MNAPQPDQGYHANPAHPTIAGLARIARMVYEGADREQFAAALTSRIANNANDAAAFMDLSMLLLLSGNRAEGLAAQAYALDIARIFKCAHGSGTGLRVLALMATGDFMSNTPLDFLFDGSDALVYYVYVADAATLRDAIPDHDVAYLAVAESDENNPLLLALEAALADWQRPLVNGRAARIAELSRDRMWRLFQGIDDVMAPCNVRLSRAELVRLSDDDGAICTTVRGAPYPIIVRPLDSHAGHGLVKIESDVELRDYIAQSDAADFYIAPFIDYRSADGRFRKYRIVFIAGRPYVAHLGISDHWMVHYLNAGMHESAEKRAEEARCMDHFDDDFGSRHRAALALVASRIGLEYFAIDCAETRDGRLLLFEAGTGMIVHSMDSAELFPYKQRQMRKIFSAFLAMLGDVSGRGVEAVVI